MLSNSKGIIIISDNFADPNSACGVCNLNLAKEFLNRGYRVWVLSISEIPFHVRLDSDYFCYIHVRESRFTSFARKRNVNRSYWTKFEWKIRYLFRLPFSFMNYPIGSPSLVRRLTRAINRILEGNNIELLLGTFSPYESIAAIMKIKQRNKNLRVVSYHLDPLLIKKNNNKYIDGFKMFKGKKAVRKELKIVDGILAQPSTKSYLSSPQIKYVYFPLYSDYINGDNPDFVFNRNIINICYVGTLDIVNRNPSFIIDLIAKVDNILSKEGKRVCLHIWGSIKDDRLLELFQEYKCVIYHGIIEPQYVGTLICQCDVALNVSNGLSYTAIPSKIFQLFAAKRPIVNVVRHPHDFSRQIFDLYPCVFNIEEYNKTQVVIESLCSFIRLNYDKRVNVDRSLFRLSDPSYICDIIEG